MRDSDAKAYVRTLVFAALLGVPVAFAAVLFQTAIHDLTHLVWDVIPDELGWSEPSDAHDRILTRLEPVARAVRACVNGEEGRDGAPAAVAEELAAFETWFEGAHGTPFYALFDQYFPEVPVVDF